MPTYDDRLSRVEVLVDKLIEALPAPKEKPFVSDFQKPDIFRNMAPPPSPETIAAGAAMADVVSDNRRSGSVHIPRSMAAPPRTAMEPVQARGSGWQDQKALTPPPGLAHIDRMLLEQDRKDAADALAQATRRAQLAKPLPPPKPKKSEAKLDAADLNALMGSDKPAGDAP